jgi:hypothetical protein
VRCESQNLETWITTATRNLALEATIKVRNEITAHVENSAHQHQLEGMGELEAKALAIQELGDAIVSAKGFERAYLTTSELKRLTRNKKQAKQLIWIAPVFLGVFAWMLYLQVSTASVSLSLLLFCLSQALYHGARGIAARRWSLSLFTISNLWLSIISILGVFFFSMTLSREGSWPWLLLISGLTIGGFVTSWQEARAWRKLQTI